MTSTVKDRVRPTVSRLLLVINQTVYGVRALRCDPKTAVRAFRLNKPDGTVYDVEQTHFGPQCDCPDFIFRRDGLDPAGCKHIRALVAEGLIEGFAEPAALVAAG